MASQATTTKASQATTAATAATAATTSTTKPSIPPKKTKATQQHQQQQQQYTTKHITVYLIRHGEREDEAEKRRKKQRVIPPKSYKEKLDPALTKEGYKQAMEAFLSISHAYQRIREKDKEQKQQQQQQQGPMKAFLFSSPLRRTIGTAMMSCFASSSALDFCLPVTTDTDTMNTTTDQDETTSNIIVMNGLCDCAAAVNYIGGAKKAVSHQLIDCAAVYDEKDQKKEEETFMPCLVELDHRCRKGMSKWKLDGTSHAFEEEEGEEKKSESSSSIIRSMTNMMSHRRMKSTKSSSSPTNASTTTMKETTALEYKKRPIKFWKETTSVTQKPFMDGDDIPSDVFEPMTHSLHLGQIEHQVSLSSSAAAQSQRQQEDRATEDFSTISSSSSSSAAAPSTPPAKKKKYDVTLAYNNETVLGGDDNSHANNNCGVEAVAHSVCSSASASRTTTTTSDSATTPSIPDEILSKQQEQKSIFFCPSDEHETFMGAVNRAAYLTALAGGDVCILVSHREGIRYLAEKYCGYRDRHHYHHHSNGDGGGSGHCRNHRLSTPYCCIGSFEAKVKMPQKPQSSPSSSASLASSFRIKHPYSVKWTFHGVAPYEKFQVMTSTSLEQSMSNMAIASSRSLLSSKNSIFSSPSTKKSPYIELVLNIPGENRQVLSILDCCPEDNSTPTAIVAKNLPKQIEITWYEFMHNRDDMNGATSSSSSSSPSFSFRKGSNGGVRGNEMIHLRILDGRRNLAGYFEWLHKQSRLAHGTIIFRGNDGNDDEQQGIEETGSGSPTSCGVGGGSGVKKNVVFNPSYQPILPCPPSLLCLNIKAAGII